MFHPVTNCSLDINTKINVCVKHFSFSCHTCYFRFKCWHLLYSKHNTDECLKAFYFKYLPYKDGKHKLANFCISYWQLVYEKLSNSMIIDLFLGSVEE